MNHHGNTARRARAESSQPGPRTTRSFAASRTATSGARPTCMKPTRPPTARRWCSARCSSGMKPTDAPLEGKKNDPMMPVAWVKTYTGEQGKTGPRLHHDHGRRHRPGKRRTRRLLVNATYWAVGLEDKIPDRTDVLWSASTTRCPSASTGSRRVRSRKTMPAAEAHLGGPNAATAATDPISYRVRHAGFSECSAPTRLREVRADLRGLLSPDERAYRDNLNSDP